jgi:peptidoglycan/xylan/chitin deacetylase (PgdA/CDA1 family)
MGITKDPCERASHASRAAGPLRLTAWLALALTACVAAGCASLSVAAAAGTWHTSPPERPLVLPRQAPRREIVVPILMYHRINVPPPGADSMERRLTVHPADFARQMTWLKRNGYRTVTQQELFEALFRGRRLGPKPIVITFDDGYSDVLHKASPVLTRLGMRATAYVISSRTTNGDRVFLMWRQLRMLERRGIEIGSHTVTHAGLTSLSDRDALRELVHSRRAFERRLHHPVQWLAYPYGAYDTRIERLARRAGYVLAVTTEHGAVQSSSRPLALSRLRVLDSTGVAGLAAMLGTR